ncbi:alcohol dehydrogenase catalytic domain-containing protein [Mycobacterium sp.]|uniref:alcohol dehydrogenase catalytic domain-containing protein n=1 Tax=Mycobacterium sp. TaxID=1785 RepID=UPI002CD8F71D|nr:alcohol dehydrogenase catalytic domain-containing protein [Mycobacterium sp.]HTH87572.1 alcohol dehydrogenase catalytic domain-containing protein [Mycobacterium sp.]
MKVGGAGACHSDLHILQIPQPGGDVAFRLPLTLGHENAGWVEQLGPGTTGFAPGDPVIVCGPSLRAVHELPDGDGKLLPATRRPQSCRAGHPVSRCSFSGRQRAPRPAVGWPHWPVGLKSRVVVTTTTSAAM